MALSEWGVNDPLAVKLWSRRLLHEVLHETVAYKFIGMGSQSMIQKKDETSKQAGDRIRMGLRMQFGNAGVAGDDTMEDNEEKLVTYYDDILIDQLRNAARSKGKMSEQRIPFSVREEARLALTDWWKDRIDTSFFNQVCGFTPQSDTRFTGMNAVVAPDADHQVWVDASANDESLTSGDPFVLTVIDKAVERAKTLSPGIRPIKMGGSEYYVAFLHPYQVTDLRQSTTTGQWLDIQKAAMTGGKVNENPIFTGSLGMYNNVVLHMDKRVTNGVRSDTGAEITTVKRAVFCGAQAAALAFGREYGNVETFNWVEELFDYRNQLGVSAGLVFGLKKSRFNSKDFATIVMSSYGAAH